jgi:hypothetical protein
MWNIDPKLLCRQHLLGEHLETHMFLGCIRNKTSLRGYIDKGLLEVHNIIKRHDELVKEMERRDYFHKSPLYGEEVLWCEGNICIEKSTQDLRSRCSDCQKRL